MNDIVVIYSINYSTEAIQYVTLDHKTSRVNFFKLRLILHLIKQAFH